MIERNIVRNNKANAGIAVSYPYRNDNVTIRNNIVYGNNGPGIRFDPNIYNYPDQVTVISNAIYGNKGDGIWIKPGTYHIISLRNNIIANNSGYGLNKQSTAAYTLGYNDIYSNTLGNYNGVEADITDISLDPLFADPAGNAEWNVSNLSSGVYLYVITSSEGTKKGKVSVLK